MLLANAHKKRHQDYESFVEKHKIKKTTDDCYTPPEVYEVIKDFAIKRYNLQDKNIIRPFYPGGDFEKYSYKENDVVIDNPPFSILHEIKDFYVQNDIKFFLFAPHLTLFSSKYKKIQYIVVNAGIIYDNGANVNTSFVTNMEKHFISVVPQLREDINKVNKRKSKHPIARVKYTYPDNVVSSALLGKYAKYGHEFYLDEKDCHFIRVLDMQREHKKEIYGAGFLISDEKAKELREKELKEKGIVWELSEKEKEIIRNLG